MFLIGIEARPGPGAENLQGAAGAFVNCWIDFRLPDGAEVLARHYVEKAGWEVMKVDEVLWVEERDHEDEESARYFRDAREHGACVVFHSYEGDEGG